MPYVERPLYLRLLFGIIMVCMKIIWIFNLFHEGDHIIHIFCFNVIVMNVM